MRSMSTSYSRNPQQKVIFIFVFVSSLRHGGLHWMANEANEALLIKRPR